MRQPVDFRADLPSEKKYKEIIFYPKHLKIYGILPYLLNRKVSGRFCSTISRCAEPNFTVITYNQSPEVVRELFEWLSEGVGFNWSIASYGEKIRFDPYKKPETHKPPNITIGQVIEVKFKVSDLGIQALREPRHDDAVLGGQNPAPSSDAMVLGDRDSIKSVRTIEELEIICCRSNMVQRLAEFYEFVDRNAVGSTSTDSPRLLTLWGDGATRINACYYYKYKRSIEYDPLDRLHIRLGNSNRVAIYSDGKLEIISNNRYVVADAEYEGLAQLKLIHENISQILSLEIARKFLLSLL